MIIFTKTSQAMKDPFRKALGIRLKLFFSKSLIRRVAVVPVICLMLIIALSGCKKDFDFTKAKDLSWNPDLALPLVNDSITLKKALVQTGTEDHLYIDESGDISILFYFNNDAFRLRPKDLIELSPMGFAYMHQVTQTEQQALSIADLTIPPVTFNINITGNDPEIRVDKLLVRQGMIHVITNHTFDNNGYLTVRILNATKHGFPYSFTISPFVSGQAQTDIDISDVLFELSSSPNTIKAEVEGFLKKSGKPVAGDEIRADFQVSISTIGWFEGFLGRQTFSQLEDTVRVDVFNNAFALGEVYFVDPQASITIINSIGIPTEITVEKLVAINNASGITLDIADRLGTGAVFPVPSPLITATQPAIKTMIYSNENTGDAMNDFYNLKPDNVAFKIKALINPTGTPLNFFSDTSSFYADLRVKLPLYGHFDHLTFQDTFDLVIDKPEEIEHLEFRTNIENGLPLTALMQVYFTDENYNKKDSLTGDDRIFIQEAPVDPATHLPYPGIFGVKDTTIILNMQRMQNLTNVKKVIVKAVLNSAEEGQINVKLKADQMMKINFSALVKLRKNIHPGK
jgi:hypothetical protein